MAGLERHSDAYLKVGDEVEIEIREYRDALTPCPDAFDLSCNVRETERQCIVRALHQTGGNRSQAAKALGLSRQGLLNKITAKQLRGAFTPRGDGFSEIAFRAYGTTEKPETDLLSRVGRAAAEDAVKGEVNKLLKRVF